MKTEILQIWILTFNCGWFSNQVDLTSNSHVCWQKYRHEQLSNIGNNPQDGILSSSVSLYSFTSVQSELGLSSLKLPFGQPDKVEWSAISSWWTCLKSFPFNQLAEVFPGLMELVYISTCGENLSLATWLETVV